MKLMTKEIKRKLLKNSENPGADHRPVVKYFTLDAQCTWWISEMDAEDNDRLFGMCDLGLGYPELGYVLMSELESVRGRLGLPVERDLYFQPDKPVSQYGRHHG